MSDSRQDTGLGLGARLRSARKARAISLEQAAQALRLEGAILQALEEERFDRLGAPVFVRGHLKAYARLLGLSEAAVLDAYRAADPGSELPRTMTRAREAPLNPSPGPWSVAALVGVLLLALGLYFLLSGTEPLPPSPIAVAPPAPPAPTAEPPPAVLATVTEAVTSAEAAPLSAAEPATPPANVLVLDFADASWVEVRDQSGRLLYTGEQAPASRRDITGEAPFSIALGNAAGVRVTLDGVDFPVPPGAVAAGSNVARFRTDGGTATSGSPAR